MFIFLFVLCISSHTWLFLPSSASSVVCSLYFIVRCRTTTYSVRSNYHPCLCFPFVKNSLYQAILVVKHNFLHNRFHYYVKEFVFFILIRLYVLLFYNIINMNVFIIFFFQTFSKTQSHHALNIASVNRILFL